MHIMGALENLAISKHEQVVIYQDRDAGYKAIIAIHDTTLGPSLGGCRMRDYNSIDEAFVDVLNLSEAMTYKNSLAGLNIGGGKSVIILQDTIVDRERIFKSFGSLIQSLGGKYITAEDMGTSVEDMSTVLSMTKYVTGKDAKVGGGGNPSPWTAKGVFDGIRACLERRYSSGDYKDRHFVIEGIGSVGYILAKHLAEAGGKLTLFDLREDKLFDACREFGANAAKPDTLYSTNCDVFSPCAIGGTINESTVEKLNCSIVAGAANNQISTAKAEARLNERGIMYAPDFAINAGGVILCADELEVGGYNLSRVEERVGRIYHTVGKILDETKDKAAELPGLVAIRLAKDRIEKARK
jgi:leucine dehydrogenase